MKEKRLDVEILTRGLVRSRNLASKLIKDRRISVDGVVQVRPSHLVSDHSQITIVDLPSGFDEARYVGRGALKLLSFLQNCHTAGHEIPIHGRRCVDVGASTGGFTQVLLEKGAEKVYALDVGTGQLASDILQNPRVINLSGISIRGLDLRLIEREVEIAVVDVSFISLQIIMQDLERILITGAILILLVKPQFEVGREGLGAKGVVSNAEKRIEALVNVGRSALRAGFEIRTLQASDYPGKEGNLEYYMLCEKGKATCSPEAEHDRIKYETLESAATIAVGIRSN